MKINLHRVRLPLAHPFTIFRGTLTSQSSLYVELEHDGISGFGEVTENQFYGHTYDSITKSLDKSKPLIDRYVTENPSDVWSDMKTAMDRDMFALSALDIAAHDYYGKANQMPTWKAWGLDWVNVPQSSYTIGIDSIETMIGKLNEFPGWGTYKIKLGTDRDLEIVTELRKHTDATFRVDANCGWTVDQAIQNSHSLAELNVEFIEQPLPITAAKPDKQKLFQESALPIVADEDCQVMEDVAKCDGLYHGVNVKICKCGGLTPALAMLKDARQRGMRTMVGCMIESSIGISGAAQLLPLLDFADLDGAVLLKDEPASGVSISHGDVKLADGWGCGSQIEFGRLVEFA